MFIFGPWKSANTAPEPHISGSQTIFREHVFLKMCGF
jgi:hypothetical protein